MLQTRHLAVPLLSASVLLAALLPTAAGAAPSGRRAVRPANPGVKLTWPLRGQRATVLPRSVVTVRVRALRRGSARVTVALTRARDGRTLRRRTLRAGSVTVKLPAATGVSYLLSAKAGRRVLRRTLLIVPSATRGWQPPGAKPPYEQCARSGSGSGPVTGTFVGDRDLIDYGQTLTVTFTNTSPSACLFGGVGFSVERRAEDRSWVPVRLRIAFPAIGLTIAPGGSRTVSFLADESWFDQPAGGFAPQPGRYRITQSWSANGGATVTGTWEFGLRLGADSRCGDPASAASARLALGSGELSLLRLANDGGVCLHAPAEIAIERVAGDGSTTPAATVTRTVCGSYGTVTPGSALAYGFYTGPIAPLLEPGRYRATTTATAAPLGGADQALPLTVDLTLDAPVGGGPVPVFDCVPPPWLP